MNKLNTKSIIFSLAILVIFTFGAIIMPEQSYSATCGEGGCNTVYSTTYNNSTVAKENNPVPVINSISPSSSNVGVGTKTITITGEGFVPSSIGRVNGSNRPTTFIDSSHLLMQVTGNDMYKYHSNGGFFITVFNGAPGGGYSNTAFFTVNKNLASTVVTANTVNDTSSNFTDTTQIENGNEGNNEYGNLAANAILGSNSFTPSGLIQWVFFAILVLLIVILVRKIYGGSEKYYATPLKHD